MGIGFDQQIGIKLREKRKQMGLTLEALSKRLGISLPQMQKYESGATKLSPRSIYELCKIFAIKPNYFFEDFEKDGPDGYSASSTLSSSTQTSPLRILIVDDNPSDVCLTQAALQDSPKDILTYEIRHPEDVIPTLNRKAFPSVFGFPDLILLDLQMPKIHGLDLLKMLKKDKVCASIPVVVLSDAMNRQEMGRVYESGGAGYICRPFSMQEYKERLCKAVDYWVDAVRLPKI